MVDTPRSPSYLLSSIFQDGQTAGISANDMRDLVVSLTPPMGGLYFSTPAATTIGSTGVYVKAAGTTTSTILSSMTMPANNRLTYTGTSPRHFHIVAQASITPATGTNQDMGIQVWKYDNSAASGAYLAMSEARTTISSTAVEQITTHGDAMLDENDYLEIHIANHTATNNATITYGYLFGMGVIM